MKNRAILIVKIVVMVVVVGWVGWELRKSWQALSTQPFHIEWRWGIISVASFCGSMLTSALVWRWLAWRMGERGTGKHLPTVPLLGAYTFSQMGKYVFGKVVLLLMRINRAARFGMPTEVCTLSTLLENTLYLISGGLIGLTAVLRILDELAAENKTGFAGGQQQFRVPLLIVAIVVLLVASTPAVFYNLVNRLLKKMKKPEVPMEQRLTMPTIVVAVICFMPCWLFGGVALWASTNAVQPLALEESLWLAGAYALSVIFGMVFLTPGGLGVREVVAGAAVAIQLTPSVGHDQAVKLAFAAAILQRLFQIVAEVLLGVVGAGLTGLPASKDLSGTVSKGSGDAGA